MTGIEGSRVRMSDETVVREVNGEAVLLHLGSEQYFALDQLSTGFLNALTEASDVAAALETLEAGYDVDAPTLRRDVEAFVESLSQQGLIEVHPPS